jgi:hypothetical protein
MTLETALDEIDLEDQFADLAADLVGLESNSVFIERLLVISPNQWRDVRDLCDRLHPVVSQLEELEILAEDSLKVSWLEHPLPDSGYCLILFYLKSLQWDSLALYNRQHFLQKFAHPVSSATR